VELGTGEGSSVTELHPFNRGRRDKRAVWEEAIQVLTGMLTSDRFEWHGEWFDFPARNVIPKPVQHPHPPLWVACSNIQTIEMAARRGLGALGFQFLTPEAAQAWVNRYYRLFVAEREPLAPYQVNPNVAIVCGFMCADTDEEARAKAEGWTFFQFALGYYGKHGALEPGAHNLWEEYLHWRRTPEGQAAEGGLIGSPETIRAQLEALQAAHVDQVILLNQAGKNTHADICHSLELFASELLEEFHGYEDDHQAWKEAVLSGEVDLLDLDTAAFHRYLGQPEINIPVTTA
jgi:alkanesulfonate monooxygenase SsuD/methylene tetrahydromethanopterin reductase-like flavin-dependent oxidoreductase (luciferase family)